MTEFTIKTDNCPRDLVCFHDLLIEDQEDFNYITDLDEKYSNRFVRFKESWYDTSDVQRIIVSDPLESRGYMGWSMVIKSDHALAQWHAVLSESYFSGVLFKFTDEDQVVCGSYYS